MLPNNNYKVYGPYHKEYNHITVAALQFEAFKSFKLTEYAFVKYKLNFPDSLDEELSFEKANVLINKYPPYKKLDADHLKTLHNNFLLDSFFLTYENIAYLNASKGGKVYRKVREDSRRKYINHNEYSIRVSNLKVLMFQMLTDMWNNEELRSGANNSYIRYDFEHVISLSDERAKIKSRDNFDNCSEKNKEYHDSLGLEAPACQLSLNNIATFSQLFDELDFKHDNRRAIDRAEMTMHVLASFYNDIRDMLKRRYLTPEEPTLGHVLQFGCEQYAHRSIQRKDIIKPETN